MTGLDEQPSPSTTQILTTPPSPPVSPPPSLVQSTSMSNSSGSPPQPTTPTSVSRTRYGELSVRGRVPLHRRGTSKTYENLEDLLREAGYKETRIITPETGRVASQNSSVQQQGEAERLKGGVGAVVGFLAGLVPGVSRTSSASDPPPPPQPQITPSRRPVRPTTPSSPLAHKRPIKPQRDAGSASSSNSSPSSSVTSDPTPRATPHRRVSRPSLKARSTPQSANNLHPDRAFVTDPSSSRGVPARQRSQRDVYERSSSYQAGPSRASAYLRHMASAPVIPGRPHSSPAHKSSGFGSVDETSGHFPKVTSEDDDDAPPLPKTWLQSVARAVLYGGGDVGRPGPSYSARDSSPFSSHSPHSNSRSRRFDVRPNHQESSRQSSVLSSRRVGGRDNLLFRAASGKAKKSESVVSQTYVVSRSAPVSRNGSRVRTGSAERERRENRKRGKTAMRAERERGRKARKNEAFVPSMARTRTEGDDWLRQRKYPGLSGLVSPVSPPSTSKFFSMWDDQGDPFSDNDSRHESATTDEDEDGEVDLTKILVPPKRQNSIRSLRKHLDPTVSAPDARSAIIRAMSGRRLSSEIFAERGRAEEQQQQPEGWTRGWSRSSQSRREDEALDEDYIGFMGRSSRNNQHSRRRIPSAWAKTATDGS